MPEAGRRVALRVEVHHQHPVVELGQRGAEVHRGGGLAHATLLVGDRDHPGQVVRLGAGVLVTRRLGVGLAHGAGPLGGPGQRAHRGSRSSRDGRRVRAGAGRRRLDVSALRREQRVRLVGPRHHGPGLGLRLGRFGGCGRVLDPPVVRLDRSRRRLDRGRGLGGRLVSGGGGVGIRRPGVGLGISRGRLRSRHVGGGHFGFLVCGLDGIRAAGTLAAVPVDRPGISGDLGLGGDRGVGSRGGFLVPAKCAEEPATPALQIVPLG